MSKNSLLLARILSYFTLTGAVALPLIAVCTWIFWDTLAPMASGNLQHVFDVKGLSAGERIAGFTVSMLGAAIQAFGLLALRSTFREAAAGRPLSAKAIKGFRHFAWITLVMVFVGIAQYTGLVAILSLSDPAHPGMMEIKVGSNELKALFLGLLLVFVAHVFAEGKRAKDENETFL